MTRRADPVWTSRQILRLAVYPLGSETPAIKGRGALRALKIIFGGSEWKAGKKSKLSSAKRSIFSRPAMAPCHYAYILDGILYRPLISVHNHHTFMIFCPEPSTQRSTAEFIDKKHLTGEFEIPS
jgi:hypothetical protein